MGMVDVVGLFWEYSLRLQDGTLHPEERTKATIAALAAVPVGHDSLPAPRRGDRKQGPFSGKPLEGVRASALELNPRPSHQILHSA